MVRCFIGLGSNLNDPAMQVRNALAALDRIADTRLVSVSSLYASRPMGPQDQPDYVNAVACVDTGLTPKVLLDALQAIENEQGRVRQGERWGPRTLDLDLLMYGRERIDTARLQVPHPGIAERSFVLLPWAEIAPDTEVPGLGRVADLLARLDTTDLDRLDQVS